jgi:hypothetical protein
MVINASQIDADHGKNTMRKCRHLILQQEQPSLCTIRETKEGWPMLTMQIRTQGVHLKGVLPRLDHWAHRAVTRDFNPALVALL